MDFKEGLFKRLSKYVKYDTSSDAESTSSPSTETQTEFMEMLSVELKELGCKDIKISPYGHLTAVLGANTETPLPVIGFITHVDTVRDFPAHDIKPKLHKDYDGGKLELKRGMFITPEKDSNLSVCIGDDIVTASGDTILGADDKAGIASVMSMLEYFKNKPEIKHGEVRLAFTPDEEIGRGADHFDVKAFGADFAYTIDGESMDEICNGNFNADAVLVTITGYNTHPGSAKGVMINPVRLASELMAMWPEKYLAETTEGEEGFILFTSSQGSLERAYLKGIVREHDLRKLKELEDLLEDLAKQLGEKYPGSKINTAFTKQYRNMKEVLEQHPEAMNALTKALKEEKLPVKITQVRGGTDGSQLTFKGLPCPNIFAAYSGAHGPYEWCSLNKLEKVTRLIIRIVRQD